MHMRQINVDKSESRMTVTLKNLASAEMIAFAERSEAWMKSLGTDIFEVYSAGTEDYPEVKPGATGIRRQKCHVSG